MIKKTATAAKKAAKANDANKSAKSKTPKVKTPKAEKPTKTAPKARKSRAKVDGTKQKAKMLETPAQTAKPTQTAKSAQVAPLAILAKVETLAPAPSQKREEKPLLIVERKTPPARKKFAIYLHSPMRSEFEKRKVYAPTMHPEFPTPEQAREYGARVMSFEADFKVGFAGKNDFCD